MYILAHIQVTDRGINGFSYLHAILSRSDNTNIQYATDNRLHEDNYTIVVK